MIRVATVVRTLGKLLPSAGAPRIRRIRSRIGGGGTIDAIAGTPTPPHRSSAKVLGATNFRLLYQQDPSCDRAAYDTPPRRTLCAARLRRDTAEYRISWWVTTRRAVRYGSTLDTMAGMRGTSDSMRNADSAIRAFVRVNSKTVVMSRGTSPGNSAATSLVVA